MSRRLRPSRMGTRSGIACVVVVVAALFVFAPASPAAVSTVFTSATGVLIVSSDGADALVVTCAGGNVQVNGSDATGPVACAGVTFLNVQGGPGANTIDLSGVTGSAFPGLAPSSSGGQTINVNAGDGNDTIVGGAFPEALDGEGGDDSITAGSAGDTLDGGDGTNVLHGGDGDDTFVLSGGSGTTTVASDPGGNNEALVWPTVSGAHTIAVGATQATLDGATLSYSASLMQSEGVIGSSGDDSVTIASDGSNGAFVDGGDGSDTYDVTFGSLSGPVQIDDSGTAGTDSLVSSITDCSGGATITPSTIVDGSQELNFSGIEAGVPTACGSSGGTGSLSANWPACDSTHATDCVEAFTIDGATPPTGFAADVFTDDPFAGFVDINVEGPNSDPLELLYGGSPLTARSDVHLELNLGSYIPDNLGTTGVVTSFAIHLGSVGGNTVSLDFSPAATSWLFDGCDVGSCGDDTTRADFDYQGLAFAAIGTVDAPDPDAGSWIATNAQAFSIPSYDATTKSFDFQVAAPHLTHAGAVNTGSFTAFIPDALLADDWGISDPSAVTTATLDVTETTGATTTTVTPTVTRVSGGIEVAVSGYSYSSPSFSIAPATASGSSSSSSSSGSSSSGLSGLSSGGSSAGSTTVTTSQAQAQVTLAAGSGSPATVAVDGGKETVVVPAAAVDRQVTVALDSVSLPSGAAGFARGGSAVAKLTVTAADGSSVTSFAAPVTLTFAAPAAGALPAYSEDGITWTPIPALETPSLPDGQADGYFVLSDGSIEIFTRHATYFGVLSDTKAPTAPASLSGRFANGALHLRWSAATDNLAVARYLVYLNGTLIATAHVGSTTLALRTFDPNGRGVYTIRAEDAAGNLGQPGAATVTVAPTPRPPSVPRRVPQWVWSLLAWQHHPHGSRPVAAPAHLPAWYTRWRAWRNHPFELAS